MLYLVDRVVGRSVTCPGCKAAVYLPPSIIDPSVDKGDDDDGWDDADSHLDSPADRPGGRRHTFLWRPLFKRPRQQPTPAESIRAMAWFTMFAGLVLAGVLAIASPADASPYVTVLVSAVVFVGGVVYGALLFRYAARLAEMAKEKQPTDDDGVKLLTPDEREIVRRCLGEPDGESNWPRGQGPSQPLTADEIAALRALLRWNLDNSSTVNTPHPPQDVTADA